MIIKSILAILCGFSVSVFLALILLPVLSGLGASQSISKYLRCYHNSKNGTPTMGGLIFVLSTFFVIFLLFILSKIHFSYSLFIVLFTLFSYMIIGFVDDYRIVKQHNNKGLSKTEKFVFQIFIALIFFYLFMEGNNEPLIWIHSLNFKLNIGFLYGVFILFVLVASSNAVNLTDGLDGLAGGLCIIAYTVFGIISFNTGWLDGYEDIGILAFVIVGSLFGFLMFNKYPAKIFMGDTGSLALGAGLGAYAIMTRHELLLVVIGLVFVIETLSCIMQIVFYKLTRRRLFPITPIHHTFESLGMNEVSIVKLFWFIGALCGLVALVYGVIL